MSNIPGREKDNGRELNFLYWWNNRTETYQNFLKVECEYNVFLCSLDFFFFLCQRGLSPQGMKTFDLALNLQFVRIPHHHALYGSHDVLPAGGNSECSRMKSPRSRFPQTMKKGGVPVRAERN